MRGFAMLGIGKTGWIDLPRPECGPLDAIVRPIAVSPCSSDVHTVWEGALGDRRNMVLGHEAVGVVEETGALVRDFRRGDRVIVSAITPDWGDRNSQRGFPMHSTTMLGGWKFSNFKNGVFSEFFHVNEADANLALLPGELDPALGVMVCDMMPTGFHAAELAEIAFGDTVVVVGIGPVGLMAVAACRLRGAGRIIAVGSRKRCREAAKNYGATDLISYRDGNIAEQVLKLTGGVGVDRVCIAGGPADVFADAVTMLKPGGVIASVNYLGRPDHIALPRVPWGCGMGHKTIRGGLMPGGRLRSEKMLELIKHHRVDPNLLITHRYYGWDGIETALESMRKKAPDLIKPVVYLE